MIYKWFTFEWWKFLWECWHGDGHKYSSQKEKATSICHFLCRVRNHTCGVVWFNPAGNDPDMSCKNCSDILG
jgi:hypothetical protein